MCLALIRMWSESTSLKKWIVVCGSDAYITSPISLMYHTTDALSDWTISGDDCSPSAQCVTANISSLKCRLLCRYHLSADQHPVTSWSNKCAHKSIIEASSNRWCIGKKIPLQTFDSWRHPWRRRSYDIWTRILILQLFFFRKGLRNHCKTTKRSSSWPLWKSLG